MKIEEILKSLVCHYKKPFENCNLCSVSPINCGVPQAKLAIVEELEKLKETLDRNYTNWADDVKNRVKAKNNGIDTCIKWVEGTVTPNTGL